MPRKKTVKKTNGKRVGTGLPGPGRPKGSQNKATKEFKDLVKSLLEDPLVEQNIRKRLQEGKADMILVKLIPYYAGVPKQTFEVETRGELNHNINASVTASLAEYEDILSSFVSKGLSGAVQDSDSGESLDPKGT